MFYNVYTEDTVAPFCISPAFASIICQVGVSDVGFFRLANGVVSSENCLKGIFSDLKDVKQGFSG